MQGIVPRWLLVGDRLDRAWFVFAIANLAAMAALVELDGPHGLETVPFHFVYVSFTILYGFRAWRAGRVLLGITFVAISTGLMTLLAIHAGREDWAELTEVPLMTLMFLAMVFHVRRRQQATATAERLAVDLRESLDRQHRFVSDASHELLTPITIGRGHLEVLTETAAALGRRHRRRHHGGVGGTRPDGPRDQSAALARERFRARVCDPSGRTD